MKEMIWYPETAGLASDGLLLPGPISDKYKWDDRFQNNIKNSINSMLTNLLKPPKCALGCLNGETCLIVIDIYSRDKDTVRYKDPDEEKLRKVHISYP